MKQNNIDADTDTIDQDAENSAQRCMIDIAAHRADIKMQLARDFAAGSSDTLFIGTYVKRELIAPALKLKAMLESKGKNTNLESLCDALELSISDKMVIAESN